MWSRLANAHVGKTNKKWIPQDHMIGKSWTASQLSDKHVGRCLGKSSQTLASQEQLEKSGLTQGGVSLSEPRNQRREACVTEIFVCLSTCLSAWQFGSINIHHDAPVQLTYATPSTRGENKQSLWGQTLSALRAAIVCCVGATNLSIALPLTCAPNNWYETSSVCVQQ